MTSVGENALSLALVGQLDEGYCWAAWARCRLDVALLACARTSCALQSL